MLYCLIDVIWELNEHFIHLPLRQRSESEDDDVSKISRYCQARCWRPIRRSARQQPSA